MNPDISGEFGEANEDMLDRLRETLESAERGQTVETTFAFVTRNPFTGLIITGDDGRVEVSDQQHIGELIGVSATGFTVLLTHIETVPGLPAGSSQDDIIDAVEITALAEPSVTNIEVVDVCDLMITIRATS